MFHHKRIIIIQLLWQPRIWDYLQLYTLQYLGWLTASSIFKSQERDNIFVQAWKLHGILLITTMRVPNFGYDRWWKDLIMPSITYVDVLPWIAFNYGKVLLLHLILIPLWLTSELLWKFYIRNWYLNIDYLYCIFVLYLSKFNISLLVRMCIHWSANWTQTYLEALGSIPIFVILLLANLPISSI